ncbi:hypothetical protein [Liquorilactobacillus hordei]|uniref:hypothetical protein n=1 Tax=Liquorilactobacillus hordei TaxID=468911 RepID=UPI0039E7D0B8
MVCKIKLYPWQESALDRLRSGSILCGGVGSGKTYTSLAFYLKHYSDKPLIVITTAKKRDTNDWQESAHNLKIDHIQVNSWNMLKAYKDVKDSFFIFDEQRVVGYGAWAKSFIKIAKANPWILLSATPGDTWSDYIPVFIANGFYRNKTDFVNQHVEFDRFAKYPKIKAYHNESKLVHYRRFVLVRMPHRSKNLRVKKKEITNYDKHLWKILQTRINPYSGEPIQTPSEFTQTSRRIVSSSEDRIVKFSALIAKNPRTIIFYNYNYELSIILNCLANSGIPYAQWNGQVHETIPDSNTWAYVVQYTAGAEGWECITTDCIVFYSLNYSYKIMEQAEGRIDRLTTQNHILRYYYFVSHSPIDSAVQKSIDRKKRFNESSWAKDVGYC